MLTNRIPDGDFILAYSFEHDDYSSLNPVLAVAFNNIGFTAFDTLSNVPFIFFVQKGKLNTAQETIGLNASTTISLQATMNSSASISNIVFSWFPGSTLNDSTIQSPKALPTDTAKYYVSAIDTLLHCSSLDSVTVNYDCASAINELILSDEVQVFPNPSSDYFIIKSSSLKLKNVCLFNTIGQYVMETDAHNSLSLSINTILLAEGIYFLRIQTDKGVLNKKVIVMKK